MEKLPFFIHGMSITDQAAASNVGPGYRLRYEPRPCPFTTSRVTDLVGEQGTKDARDEAKVSLEAVLSKPLAASKNAVIDGRVEIGTKSWPAPLHAGIDAISVTWSMGDPDVLASLGEIVDTIAGRDTIRLDLPSRSLDFPLAGASEALAGMPCLP